MTAKETLHRIVDQLSEVDAAPLLERLPALLEALPAAAAARERQQAADASSAGGEYLTPAQWRELNERWGGRG